MKKRDYPIWEMIRYIMRTLMKPFIERDSEMRAKEQEYCSNASHIVRDC